MVKPFKVRVFQINTLIKDIYDKGKKISLGHEMPNDMNGWEYGTNLDYMKKISKYWTDKI